MESLATEIETKNALEKMANAISRIESAVQKRSAKDNIRSQILTELDNCISGLEELLTNPK
jgi:hypothetical protein